MMDDIFDFVWLLFLVCWVINGLLKFFGLIESGDQRHARNNKRQWVPWQKLAETNNLSFIPNKSYNDAKVCGKYGNHHLTLKGSGSNNNPYTQLTVTQNKQDPSNVSLRSIGVPEGPFNVGDMVRLFAPDKLGHYIWGNVRATSNGRTISYEQSSLETSTKYLQFLFDWLSDIADAYPAIVALGSEAMLPLKSTAERNNRLSPLVIQLLRDMAHKAVTQIGYRVKNVLCLRCFTRFDTYKLRIGSWLEGETFTYYGCRTCQQSREFFEGWVVARLDNTMTQELVQHNGVLRVNWLSRRTLFDFDEVEIVQATDEEVERFAVQVGNDTDRLRKPRYQQMRCVVSADCDLSENSHRILRRMFGSVELRDTEFIREVADSHERTTNHRNRTIDPEAIYAGGRTGSATVGR